MPFTILHILVSTIWPLLALPQTGKSKSIQSFWAWKWLNVFVYSLLPLYIPKSSRPVSKLVEENYMRYWRWRRKGYLYNGITYSWVSCICLLIRPRSFNHCWSVSCRTMQSNSKISFRTSKSIIRCAPPDQSSQQTLPYIYQNWIWPAILLPHHLVLWDPSHIPHSQLLVLLPGKMCQHFIIHPLFQIVYEHLEQQRSQHTFSRGLQG